MLSVDKIIGIYFLADDLLKATSRKPEIRRKIESISFIIYYWLMFIDYDCFLYTYEIDKKTGEFRLLF